MKASDIIETDNRSLLQWGRQRDKVISLIDRYCIERPNTLKTAESNANHLFKEVMKLEEIGRNRVRLYWEIKNENK